MVKAARSAMPFTSKSGKVPKPLKPRNHRDKTRDKVMSGLKALHAPAVSCRQTYRLDTKLENKRCGL